MVWVITSLFAVEVVRLEACEPYLNFVGCQKTNTQPQVRPFKGLDVSGLSSTFGGKVGVGSMDGGS